MAIKWQFRIRESITGPRLVGVRRNGRGPWLHPRDTPSVRFYLCADESGKIEILGDQLTPVGVIWAIRNDEQVKPQRAPKGYLFQGILALEPTLAEIDAARATRRMAIWKARKIKGIYNLRDLHAHVGSMSDDSTEKACVDGIAHRLYKDTDCGIGFSGHAAGVSVSGYCEGTDAECPSYELLFPFKGEEFDRIVKEADADGCRLWDDTHGCEKCGGDGEINPDCKACKGEGVIL